MRLTILELLIDDSPPFVLGPPSLGPSLYDALAGDALLPDGVTVHVHSVTAWPSEELVAGYLHVITPAGVSRAWGCFRAEPTAAPASPSATRLAAAYENHVQSLLLLDQLRLF